MSDTSERLEPTERLRIPITTNVVTEASRFCIEQCGFMAEAQEMAMVASVMSGEQPAYVSWAEEAVPEIKTEAELPNIVLRCKGPKKQFVLFGEYVCRQSASIDTE